MKPLEANPPSRKQRAPIRAPEPRVEVKRYQKEAGWTTRYWAIYVDGNLLAVVLYRKGAEAIAAILAKTNPS
jgi:hypothetical protein